MVFRVFGPRDTRARAGRKIPIEARESLECSTEMFYLSLNFSSRSETLTK